MGFKDYLKWKIILQKKVFSDHTKGYYLGKDEQRHRIFPHLPEILNKPDEVWLHSHDINERVFQLRYLKFYKNMAIIIDTNLEENNMEITTWHNLKVKDGYKRKGLLIKKAKGLTESP